MNPMPVAIHGPLVDTDSQPVRRKMWTREECDFLVQSGAIDPQRYELLEGELVEKVSKIHPHVRALLLLCNWLREVFGPVCVVQEPSIHLAPRDTPYSDPEPDALVLSHPYDKFVDKANPEDIVLVVEVSDTSLAVDLTRKAALYARAAIQDYWVLDVNGRRIIVHREPRDGVYQSITAFADDEPVNPLAAKHASACAANFL